MSKSSDVIADIKASTENQLPEGEQKSTNVACISLIITLSR